MLKIICPLLLVVAFVVPSVRADQIVLKNGDRISGSIISSDGTGLVIKSELAGTITIPMEVIVQITSDQPLYLTLRDGQKILGTVEASSERIEVRTEETGEISLDRINIIGDMESQREMVTKAFKELA